MPASPQPNGLSAVLTEYPCSASTCTILRKIQAQHDTNVGQPARIASRKDKRMNNDCRAMYSASRARSLIYVRLSVYRNRGKKFSIIRPRPGLVVCAGQSLAIVWCMQSRFV